MVSLEYFVLTLFILMTEPPAPVPCLGVTKERGWKRIQLSTHIDFGMIGTAASEIGFIVACITNFRRNPEVWLGFGVRFLDLTNEYYT